MSYQDRQRKPVWNIFNSSHIFSLAYKNRREADHSPIKKGLRWETKYRIGGQILQVTSKTQWNRETPNRISPNEQYNKIQNDDKIKNKKNADVKLGTKNNGKKRKNWPLNHRKQNNNAERERERIIYFAEEIGCIRGVGSYSRGVGMRDRPHVPTPFRVLSWRPMHNSPPCRFSAPL